MLAVSEPLMKEDAMLHFVQFFVFPNFSSNEAMGGNVWVMCNIKNDFDVVSMSD